MSAEQFTVWNVSSPAARIGADLEITGCHYSTCIPFSLLNSSALSVEQFTVWNVSSLAAARRRGADLEITGCHYSTCIPFSLLNSSALSAEQFTVWNVSSLAAARRGVDLENNWLSLLYLYSILSSQFLGIECRAVYSMEC